MDQRTGGRITLKKVNTLIVCAAILCALCVPVRAHPGNTDGNGGHTNQGTGEYHYHHGYPAHDHYDMDGDGDVDCPYDFKDKTGSNIVGKNYSEINSSTVQEMGEVKKVPVWVYFVFAILIVTIICLSFSNHSKKAEIDQLVKKEQNLCRNHETELDTMKKAYQNQFRTQEGILEYQKKCSESQMKFKDKAIEALNSENKDLTEELHRIITTAVTGETYYPRFPLPQYKLFTLTIPDDIYFIDGYIPVKGEISDRSPYGDFTVYMSAKGKVYHSERCCSSGIVNPVHLYEVPDGIRPCTKCGYRKCRIAPEWYCQVKKIRHISLQKQPIKE